MLLSLLLDFLFPISCAGCGMGKIHCCGKCLAAVPRFSKIDSNQNIIAAAPFCENSILAKLIHRFKYDSAKDLAPLLVSLFDNFLLQNFLQSKEAVLVPVPLHKRRLNFRGFNQSEVLAHEMGRKWGRLACNLLQRHRYTKPQAELDGEKRLTNLLNAFSMKLSSAQINPETHYFLVDDVCTTGATISECAKVLKKHGAKNVKGLVIGRTV